MGLNVRRQGWVGRRLGMESLEERRVLATDFAILNINATPSGSSSSPEQFISVGERVFFTASDATHGRELWTTDGTEAGTTFVKDLNVGVYGSQFLSMTAVNGMLFFTSDNGKDLWRSDGTEAGTVRLLDLTTPTHSPINSLVEYEGNLYFTLLSGGMASLWSSDGSIAGTTPMLDATSTTMFASIYSLTNANGTLFFAADDGVHGFELWKSDGTTSGTTLVADIAVGAASSLGSNVFASTAGTTYFFANDGVHGRELWKSDGTAAGTTLVADLQPGAAGSIAPGVKPELVSTGDDVYFAASAGGLSQLWRTNGTAGTPVVMGTAAGLHTPTLLTNVAGTLMFSGEATSQGPELWRSVDTPDGATQVIDIYPGNPGSSVQQLTNVGGALYFWAKGPGPGATLQTWKSDGTTAGTIPLQFIEAVNADAGPREIISFGDDPGEILLAVTIDGRGKELWRATDDSYSLVKDIAGGEAGARPDNLVIVDDLLYFTTPGAAGKLELWATTGTAIGTTKIHDRVSSPFTSVNRLMVEVGGSFYFVGNSSANGDELWRTDGTTAGTTLVADIRPGSASSGVGYLTNVNGTLFFNANDGSGRKLWKLDESGAALPLTPAGLDFYLLEMVGAGDSLFFTANGGIWTSDGTAMGTTMLVDFGGPNETPRYLTEMNDKLYLSAGPSRSQWELWTSDGTVAGTTMLKDIEPGLYGSIPHALANVGGTLFFGADDGVHGVELWTSDGTAVGTTMVEDSIPGASGLSFIETMIDVEGTAFYYANNGVRGMWYSDGTSSGTGHLSSLLPAGSSTRSRSFAKAGGRYYFEANDGVHGQEIRSTDLTPEGTWLVDDLTGDSGGSLPDDFVVLNDKLLVTATSLTAGRELWVATLPPAAGDYTGDGATDGADFLAWQRSFGSAATPAGSGADGDGNGSVGSSDLAVWQAGFGAGSATPLAASSAAVVASELSVASLTASDEVSASAVGERFDDAAFDSAADAAFAWLAGERTTPDHGVWKRSPAVEAELRARDHAARSPLLAPPARNERDGDGKPGDFARKLRTAELSFGAGEAAAESQGFLPATLDEWATREAFRAAIRR